MERLRSPAISQAFVHLRGRRLGARAQRAGATSTQVNLIMIAVANIVCGGATTAGGAWSLPTGMVGWLGLAGAGGGITIGLVAFFAALRFIGPVRATMLSNVEPLLGVLFAVAVLGERLTSLQWIGVALVVAALTLLQLQSRRTKRRERRRDIPRPLLNWRTENQCADCCKVRRAIRRAAA